MIIEYYHYDIATKDSELSAIIEKISKYNIQLLSVLPSHVKIAKSFLPQHISLSTPIDYPFGILDAKSKLSSIEHVIKYNVNIVDIVCPSYYLCNRKYEKFKEDIKNIQSLVMQCPGIELRYVLEYRQFNYELLYKIAQILYDFNIKVIYPSTGYFIDDIADNMTASALINKKVPEIGIISTGNIWNENHVKLIKNANLFGLRVNSLNALELLYKENII
jgi:deoxyribose-phosphate aldolase